MISCLPGRLAILVEEDVQGEILIPERVKQTAENLEIPPYELMRGTVQSGDLPKGTVVYVRRNAGLVIGHSDPDFPSISGEIPKGFTLRLYRPGYDEDEVLCTS